MPSVNTKRIEESATTALKAALLRCPILESYIDSNDKTPSWDGTVFVYKSEKTKKEDLAGRVPIQIKGTEKVQITKRRRTLSTSEIIELAKLTENSYPPATRCGAYLLMDADEEAQKCFDELPLIAQEEFLKYPICHFGKLTMKEDKPNG